MKKILLSESERKAIISEKEKAIIANFAKTFNSIKRIDENEVEEGFLKNLAAGALATAGSLTGQANAQSQPVPNQSSQEMSQIYNEPIDSVIEKGGSDLGMVLIDLYHKNPELAQKWEMNGKYNKSIHLINSIKNANSAEQIGNIYGGEESNLGDYAKDFIGFMKNGGENKTASL